MFLGMLHGPTVILRNPVRAVVSVNTLSTFEQAFPMLSLKVGIVGTNTVQTSSGKWQVTIMLFASDPELAALETVCIS